ncbi:UDP-galactose transporter [Irineochytrium annulatum]|nr:UDP-galactose transporter [Irineochytrium annulatum]
MGSAIELAVIVVGIYTCFLTWGLTQERVTKSPYDGQKFKYFMYDLSEPTVNRMLILASNDSFLNVIQSLIASIVAYVYLLVRRQPTTFPSRSISVQYLQLSLSSALASPFGYASLKYIDYPTMILGKSCKLIPVMIMDFILYRKTYPPKKHLIVALITAGVSGFMLLQPSKDHKGATVVDVRELWQTLLGLALLMTNLALDGVTNTTQDRIFKKHRPTGSHMMLYMNLYSTLLMLAFLLCSDPFTHELRDALSFSMRHPAVILDILLFGLCGAVGQCFIYRSLESFGSITTVTINLTRKMWSVVLSVLVYDHELAWQQWVCVGIVFMGITLESLWKDRKPVQEVVVDVKRAADAIERNGEKSERVVGGGVAANKGTAERRRTRKAD